MTDLLLKPDDTGDIPAVGEKTVRLDPVGEGTRNLAPYARNLPPTRTLRLYVTTELPLVDRGCRTVEPNDEDFVRPGQPTPPPVPAEPPAPKPEEAYVGRHRREEDRPADVPPGRFGWLRSVLAAGWARVRGSM